MVTLILRSPKWPYIFVQKSLINAVTHQYSLNFIRLLRVVITPSVVERRKRLEAIRHILKSLPVDVFYNFTPLIRPLIRNRKI